MDYPAVNAANAPSALVLTSLLPTAYQTTASSDKLCKISVLLATIWMPFSLNLAIVDVAQPVRLICRIRGR